MIIDYKYQIGQKVLITDIGLFGRIVGFYYGETGIQYQVVYFAENKKETAYLYEFQIEIEKQSVGSGFGAPK